MSAPIGDVAALFVDPRGVYPTMLGRESCWANDPESAPGNGPRTRDDAREYPGPDPVVAHPPCNLWVNFAAVNWARYRRELPAWYPGGDDGGCFASALASVRKYGGVLEHPAGSHAWPYNMPRGHNGAGWLPGVREGWICMRQREWTCEVWQSAYVHKARKRTWLLYCGARPPFELRWAREPGTHQCGWFDRNRPTLSKRAASATPPAFAAELIALARWSRG